MYQVVLVVENEALPGLGLDHLEDCELGQYHQGDLAQQRSQNLP